MITVVILSLLTLAIVIGWIVSRKRARSARGRDEIPLFTIPASALPGLPRPAVASPAERLTPYEQRAASPPRSTAVADRDMRFAPSAPTIRTRDGAVSTLLRPPRNDAPTAPVTPLEDEMGEAVDGASIRFWRPADGTLQFLPGRLEIAAGRDAGHEIRFVRTGGPEGTCITFGRADGPPYRHVQLREPTVSRSHARMDLEQTPPPSDPANRIVATPRWRLENLSSTNPVVVNGNTLDAKGGPESSVTLSEGDRIEMGEVAFVFHER